MRSLACCLAMVLCAGCLFAETRVVKVTSKGQTKEVSTTLRESAEGPDTRFLQESGQDSVETLLGEDGKVRYQETRSADGAIRMSSDGMRLKVTGTWKGKALSGDFDLKGLGFYGNGFDFALRALASEGLDSLKFPMVRPADPPQFVVMALNREGADTYAGQEAVKVKISLTGALAAFWSGHLLMGQDGAILRFSSNQGPGGAEMVTELVEVRP
jgi:hypothetical protein